MGQEFCGEGLVAVGREDDSAGGFFNIDGERFDHGGDRGLVIAFDSELGGSGFGNEFGD